MKKPAGIRYGIRAVANSIPELLRILKPKP